jgi:hypothetical protein
MITPFQSSHKLDFLNADDFPYSLFKIGTCNGQWGCLKDSYFILSILNDEPGNGHLDDVFEWFENSCKRDGKNLLVLEIMNERFYTHLTSKKGFIPLDDQGDNVVKVFNFKAYQHLLENGNEIIQKGSLTCV